MCHIRLTALFLAILACLSILYCPGAQAQAAGSVEQNFADSLTTVPPGSGANFAVDWAAMGEIAEPAIGALMVDRVGSGHYAFISQGRPIKIIGKN